MSKSIVHPPAQPIVFESEFVDGVREIFEQKIVFNTVLGEELLFRGVIFQYLRSRYLAVARGLFEATVISALAFASLHLGGSILPILPVGIILALAGVLWFRRGRASRQRP